jgi:chromate transporter
VSTDHHQAPKTPAADDSAAAAAPTPTDLVAEHLVPLGTMTRTWFAISLQTFGGPAGQIAVMHRALVDEKRWIGEKRFLHALNYCMLLPGPEAQQLATYVGWLLHGTRGGLIAGGLFVMPGFVALLALSAVYAAYGDTAVVTAVFAGLAPAVLAIVAQAVVRVGRKALRRPVLVGLAVAAFLALTFFAVPFPIVVAAAGLIGFVLGRWRPDVVTPPRAQVREGPEPLISDNMLHTAAPSARRTMAVLLVGLLVWWLPVLAGALLTGTGSTFTQMGVFFSGTAVVTFGGAYAVLAYVAQKAVEVYAWVTPSEMVRGLALAETTPGPLIMVVQFVAFLGAYRNPGTLDPWAASVLASILVTWVTFVPCFLFVFLGAPYMERLRGNKNLTAALTGVTAAVVGVIANLAVYFAVNTLFTATTAWSWGPISIDVPMAGSVNPLALGIAAVAALLMFWLKRGVLTTLGICAGLGLAAGIVDLIIT